MMEFLELVKEAPNFNAMEPGMLVAYAYAMFAAGTKASLENAKLREQVERLHAEQVYWELGNCPGCPNVADLQEALEQNSKLRELGRSAVRCITDVPDCDLCALGEQVSGVWICHFIRAAKELGIEVDE